MILWLSPKTWITSLLESKDWARGIINFFQKMQIKIIWITPAYIFPGYSLNMKADVPYQEEKINVQSYFQVCVPVDHTQVFALWAHCLSHIPSVTCHMSVSGSTNVPNIVCFSPFTCRQLVLCRSSCCVRAPAALPGWATHSEGHQLCALLNSSQVFLVWDLYTPSLLLNFCQILPLLHSLHLFA